MADKMVKKTVNKEAKLDGKNNQLNHQKKLFLVNLTNLQPNDFTLSKYHLVNQIKKAANQENNELTRVATYEQFLKECGELNQEMVELVELRNILLQLRKEQGLVGQDIPLQKFDPRKDGVLNEEVIPEYNRLIGEHNAGVFSRDKFESKLEKTMHMDKKLAKLPSQKKENVDILKDIRKIHKANAKRKARQLAKPFEDHKKLIFDHQNRRNVVQPLSQNVPLFVNEDVVDADEIEMNFRQEQALKDRISKIEEELSKKQFEKEMKLNEVISKVRLQHKIKIPTDLVEGTSQQDSNSDKRGNKKIREVSAEQAWKNWERFEESIKPGIGRQKKKQAVDRKVGESNGSSLGNFFEDSAQGERESMNHGDNDNNGDSLDNLNFFED